MEIETTLPKLSELGAIQPGAETVPSIDTAEDFELVLAANPIKTDAEVHELPSVPAMIVAPPKVPSTQGRPLNKTEFFYDHQTWLPVKPAIVDAEILVSANTKEFAKNPGPAAESGQKMSSEPPPISTGNVPHPNWANADRNEPVPPIRVDGNVLSTAITQENQEPSSDVGKPATVQEMQNATKFPAVDFTAIEKIKNSPVNPDIPEARSQNVVAAAAPSVAAHETVIAPKTIQAAIQSPDVSHGLPVTKPEPSPPATENSPRPVQRNEMPAPQLIAEPETRPQSAVSDPLVEASYRDLHRKTDSPENASNSTKESAIRIAEPSPKDTLVPASTPTPGDAEKKHLRAPENEQLIKDRTSQISRTQSQIAFPVFPERPAAITKAAPIAPSKFVLLAEPVPVSHDPVVVAGSSVTAPFTAPQVSRPSNLGTPELASAFSPSESDGSRDGALFEAARAQLPTQLPAVGSAQSAIDHAPRIIQMIAESARALQDKPVELTLSPEELGKVRLTLQAGDGSMIVAISAERAETLELLRRNIDQLAAQFREIGFQDLSFQFSGENSSDNENLSSDNPGVADASGTTEYEAHPTQDVHRVMLGADGRIDIRL